MSLLPQLVFYSIFGLVWLVIVYQFILMIAGCVYFRRYKKLLGDILYQSVDYPAVTLLVPAHNEEKVVELTVRHLLALDYPADKLDILVIDDASTDDTPAIIDRLAAEDSRVRVLHRTRPDGGRGKAAALNHALRITTNELVAVYDADNRPESNSLRLLIAELVQRPHLVAAVGRFRTGNRLRNMLTRFINIEGLTFQGVMQGGRCQLLGIANLTGTNYVIRRSIVQQLGGWDEEALAEDAELTVRLYQQGYKLAFLPFSVSWEQEPETFAVWLRQRTRWARGSNYAMLKLIRTFSSSKNKLYAAEIFFVLGIPYLFLLAILLSQILCLYGLFNIDILHGTEIPMYMALIACVLYMVEVLVVLSHDNETTPGNVLVMLLMYFTYCQAWPLAHIRAFYADVVLREKCIWDKTTRFDEVDVRGRPMVLSGSLAFDDQHL